MQKERKNPPKKAGGMLYPISEFHVDVDRLGSGSCVLVSGTRGISEFSEKCVLLRLKGSRFRISGEALRLTVYENGRVEIVGKILCMEFIYDKT